MIWLLLNGILLVYGAVVCLLNKYYKHISFGWGLGDVLWELFMYVTIIMHLSILLLSYDNHGFNFYWLYATVFFCLWVIISLKATLLRGGEYKWNGKIFYERKNSSQLIAWRPAGKGDLDDEM